MYEVNPGTDVNAVEEESPNAGMPSWGSLAVAPGATPEMQGLQQQTLELQQRQMALRQKQFDDAKALLMQQRAGPGVSERLYQLSAALAAPMYGRGGVSGLMNNLAPMMARQRTETRVGEEGRAKELLGMQQKYDTGTLEGEKDILDYKYKLAELARKSGQTQVVWSEKLQRFVPKNTIAVIGRGTLDGAPTLHYNTGDVGVQQPDGTYAVYDAGGTLIGKADNQGRPVNGATP